MFSEVVTYVIGSWPKLSRALGVLAMLWLLAAPGRAQAQGMRVSGSVTAAGTRQPVPGATVQVQRTRRGMITNATGEFAVDALATDTILFRALGFKGQRLPLGGTGLSQLVVRIQQCATACAWARCR